jgi:hypothetical protein
MRRFELLVAVLACFGVVAGSARADLTGSLKKQTVELKSANSMAFGPESILFIGDSAAATIWAVATGDTATGDRAAALNIEKFDSKVAEALGSAAANITINDMKVNPATGNVFVSVSRRGGDAATAILRVDRAGKISELSLKDVPASRVTLPNVNEKRRTMTITCMAFMKDRLFVSGLSNEDFNSTLRTIPVPFPADAVKGTGIEIYHGNHGKLETASPIRSFTFLDIAGQANLLAAYQCTPLVKMPVEDLKAGSKVRGTTIAELGNQNTPLDMVVYQKDGKTFVLMSNDRRGVMKIITEGIEKVEAISTRIGGIAGVKYDTVSQLKGVEQLDRLNDTMVVLLVKGADGKNLQSVPLP